MGAGVIPLAVKDGEVLFLFQKTFTGRKVGYLIDFGGGLGDGEDYRAAAVREFVEETETMYLTDDLGSARRSEDRVREQITHVKQYSRAPCRRIRTGGAVGIRRATRKNPGTGGPTSSSFLFVISLP